MSESNEKDDRRIATRKSCELPVRYSVLTEELVSVPYENPRASAPNRTHRQPEALRNEREGQTVNLSERGLYFTSHENVRVGEPLEIFFTLPTELTGRSPEQVCVRARVVHVDKFEQGSVGIGAAIERFERISKGSNWDN
jgi:PilZ domain